MYNVHPCAIFVEEMTRGLMVVRLGDERGADWWTRGEKDIRLFINEMPTCTILDSFAARYHHH
jgi:hypothetical protein